MLFYSIEEILMMVIAAIVIDWIVGDPRWIPHPVMIIGKLIKSLEGLLYLSSRIRGSTLTILTIGLTFAAMLLLIFVSDWIHPWLGYVMNVWFISTTIAIKGLKDAALLVYNPLTARDIINARTYVGYIVGRDTDQLNQPEITRATVETVAENTVDAVVSPLFYAILGGAPLAMLYRATNTLDSMVGYKNPKYLHFGWASARLDDFLNWIPARLSGMLLVIAALVNPQLSAGRSWKAIRTFAALHPSPNSGIPESAAAGALGIQLGGVNFYDGHKSERARMGWALRDLKPSDIKSVIYMLYMVSMLWMGGLLCALCFFI